jgi:hypothetical protein
VSEGGGASGSVARPPGAGTIRVSTRGRIRRRTNFVRRGRPGGREELRLMMWEICHGRPGTLN